MVGWVGLCNTCTCIYCNILLHTALHHTALHHRSRLLIARNKEREVVIQNVRVFVSCILLASKRACMWPIPS